MTQTDASQDIPSVQAFPQVPQLRESLVRSEHAVPQRVWPSGQVVPPFPPDPVELLEFPVPALPDPLEPFELVDPEPVPLVALAFPGWAF